MKKILILLTIGLFLTVSCNEDTFLEEDPKDDIFADNLFVDYDGFVNGLNAIYSLVRDERESSNNVTRAALWQMGTDNAFVNNGAGATDPFNDYTDLNSENSLVSSNFNWLYRIINASNLIINRAENSSVDWMGGNDDANVENQNEIIAHAKLLRAWAYRHLRYGWGAVPLSLEEIDGTTYRNDWERNSVEEINAQMELDLTFARDYLDMKEETGFGNGAVAGTMLAELYLDMGEDEKAATEALKVINDGTYELMTERFGVNAAEDGNAYSDVFDNPNPGDGNKEVLWVLNNAYQDVVGSSYIYMKNTWITYYAKDKVLKKLELDTLYTYNGGKGAGRISVSDAAFNWYEEEDDRYSEYNVKKYYIYPTDGTATEFEVVGTTNMDYSDESDLEDHFLWPWVRKWEYNDPYVFENASRAGQYDDQIFMRLAETYLIAAEALMNQGNNALAADYLNALRRRSNASEIEATDVTLEFILQERSRELVTEEYRKHTLVRTGKFYEWAIKYNPRLDATKVFEYNELFPIPQGIIDSNTGAVMEQNPGYSK
ncbi:RagB/SusD family nutrient uptake outer membrane protein [Maribacter polysaccharolyticus]|uniref:RagB/SusD family nutrient uptake outer membrane protein n=1 Tax=Maribacter polysaccharolyticus TaxID=3020831 RepID=UPI00237FB731|nr:RagB/SusD family nutrient uptake outer membrane protein [Maribacter polysaccharolyticus]MDE3740925.1 RagB/SusD family nutrient uptake outer membrane protein [Maribacter polysaccharolyticus]